MRQLLKNNKGEIVMFIAFFTFLMVNCVIDEVSTYQVAGFILVTISIFLRVIILNKNQHKTKLQ